MKLNNNQAAYLYLLLFNIGESGNPDFDRLQGYCEGLLDCSLYGSDAVIDTEGQPMIDWGMFESNWDYDTWLFGDSGHGDIRPDLDIVLDKESFEEQKDNLREAINYELRWVPGQENTQENF